MSDYDDDATSVQGSTPPPPGRPLSPDQKSAIAAALVGTAALGGAAWGMSRYLDDGSGETAETDPNPNGDTPPPYITPPPGDVLPPPIELTDNSGANGLGGDEALVSTVDREAMTFEDAFRAARAEMGPSHYFEWHGQLYNTFYKDEWDGKSHEEQQEFLASVYGDDMPGAGGSGGGGSALAGGGGAAPDNSLAGGEIPPPVDDVPVAEADEPNIVVVEDTPPSGGPDETPVVAVVDEGTPQPQTPEQAVDVVVSELDGQEILVFDVNNDDRPDAILNRDTNIILIDTDHDQLLDTQATYNTDTHQFTNVQKLEQQVTIDGSMDVLHQSEEHPDTSLANDFDFGADFDNNADTSDYDYTT